MRSWRMKGEILPLCPTAKSPAGIPQGKGVTAQPSLGILMGPGLCHCSRIQLVCWSSPEPDNHFDDLSAPLERKAVVPVCETQHRRQQQSQQRLAWDWGYPTCTHSHHSLLGETQSSCCLRASGTVATCWYPPADAGQPAAVWLSRWQVCLTSLPPSSGWALGLLWLTRYTAEMTCCASFWVQTEKTGSDPLSSLGSQQPPQESVSLSNKQQIASAHKTPIRMLYVVLIYDAISLMWFTHSHSQFAGGQGLEHRQACTPPPVLSLLQ